MSDPLLTVLSELSYLSAGILVLVIGLYGYGFYAMIVITRILHEIQRQTRRPSHGEEA